MGIINLQKSNDCILKNVLSKTMEFLGAVQTCDYHVNMQPFFNVESYNFRFGNICIVNIGKKYGFNQDIIGSRTSKNNLVDNLRVAVTEEHQIGDPYGTNFTGIM